MKNFFYKVSLLISTSLGISASSYAFPPEARDPVVDRLEGDELKNFTETSKDNAEAGWRSRLQRGIIKSAKISCPAGAQVIQAFKESGIQFGRITLNKVPWDVFLLGKLTDEQLSKATVEEIQGARLSSISLSPEAVVCMYEKDNTSRNDTFSVKNNTFTLSRSLKFSRQNKLKPETCKAAPGYPEISVSKAYNPAYKLSPADGSTHFPEGLEIICEQEEERG